MNYGSRKNRFQLHRVLQIFVFLFVAHSSTAFALDEINTTYFGSQAIEGYDAVAYFTQGRAVEGSKEFEFSWKGANWRFASTENLAAFRANPEAFAPQFGGYCAWAVSQNDIAEIDPTQFTVYEGKLYLNYSKEVSARWRSSKEKFITAANRFWPELLEK